MFTDKKIKFGFLLIFAYAVIFTSNLFAGTTGKISGQIKDANTGELLIGANVVLAGTTLGAASDIEGEYFIINIPPGVYEVKVSSIGYSAVTVKNVRVSVDQTTKLDFDLTSEALQVNEIIVTAERPIVQKDLTSTEAKISGDQISMLPLEDVSSVINLQAGVVDGHFRGGRSNEVKYLIDGVAVNDAYSGGSAMEAEINSIQELQVLTGTFNAEYGEALSGVVNQITKIAGDKLEGDVSFYTGDYISSRKNLFQNIDHITPKDLYNFQGNLSGPVPGLENMLKFFISGRYIYDAGSLYGKRIFNPSDSSSFPANNPEDWYVESTGDSSYVPMNDNTRYTLQGKLSLDIGTGGKGIVLSTMYQNEEYRDYNHSFKLNPDGDYTRFQTSFMTSLSYTHMISNSAFVDFLGSIFNTDYKQYAFEDPYDLRYVNPDRLSDVSGNAFLTGGTQNWQFFHESKTYNGKIDFTWQIDKINQIKTGIEYKDYHLDYTDYQIVIDASTNYKPSLPEPGEINYNQYSTNPYQFSLYLQDKIELDYLIVNIGFRYDLFEPDGEYLKNPDKIAKLGKPPFPDSMMATAKSKHQLSPRIGLSYPITDKGAIHISYGHFFQIPAFEYLYRNPNFIIPLTGNYPENIGTTIGNADLKAQQTVMYEIGLQQELVTNFGITITAYYKDIRNLLSSEIHIKNEFKKFSKLINQDYGSVKGFTISFEKRFSDGIGANLDYTFQIAKGNASDPNDAFEKAQANPPIEANKQLVPLNWDRKHSLNFTLTAGTPGDMIGSLVGRFGSGLPYTPSLQNQRTGLENSENRPAFFNIDLYFTKYFDLFEKPVSVFVKVYNVFDTANEIEIFGDTGRAGYTLELTRAQEAPLGVNTLAEYYTRPDFYSAPRQVIVGASFSF